LKRCLKARIVSQKIKILIACDLYDVRAPRIQASLDPIKSFLAVMKSSKRVCELVLGKSAFTGEAYISLRDLCEKGDVPAILERSRHIFEVRFIDSL
jgi:hypothetical protein